MWDCPCCGAEVEGAGPPWWSGRRWGPPPWARGRGGWWDRPPTRREHNAALEEHKRRLEEELAEINEELSEA